MVDAKQIKEWRKYRRRSIRTLPIAIGLFVVICTIIYVVNLFVAVPTWLAVLLIGISAFAVLGDLTNIIYLGRKLRHAGESERTEKTT